MKKTRIAAMAGLALLLGSPLFANSTTELLRVLATLYRIHDVVANIRGVTEDIRTKLSRVWPDRALHPLLVYMEPVMSIQQELRQLSCGWQFSVRTDRLRAGLFEGHTFCRQEWQAIFGPPAHTRFADMDEYYDWSAVRRLNTVSHHVTQNEKWAEQAGWLTTEALKGTYNPGEDQGPDGRPGYAQRLSALGAAQMGNFLAEQGKLQAYDLELAQEKLNDRRYRQRLQENFAVTTYSLMAGTGAPAAAAALPEALR